MKKFLLIFCLFLSPCFAAQEKYPFTHSAQQVQFESLTSELRCLVCQNQNIAESNAALANDLRDQVYHQILQGKSDKEIIDYLVARYGNYILYQPPLNSGTIILWGAPFLFLVFGVGYLFYYIKKSRKS